MKGIQGQVRTVVRDVWPTIESGRYAIKRVVGETVTVWADVFADGHDIVRAAIQYKHQSERKWREVPARLDNADRWTGTFTVEKQGWYSYRVAGWADSALYWQYGITKKADAGVDVTVELMEGIEFMSFLQKKTKGEEKAFVQECKKAFSDKENIDHAISLAKSERLTALFEAYPNRPFVAYNEGELRIYVDREKAAFSTWYEFFPRSAGKKGHGTFKDCINLLPRIEEFGFDTVYLPPVHPIGITNRKGKNNTTTAEAGDVGSCWGIGAKEGGHTDLHPELGSLKDFKKLIKEAKKRGIEIAMDYALQATPDHPWVKSNPEWFKQRPDGSIQYAENPPKKYQDIYPIWFETEDWKAMWQEFLDVLLFWIDQGINVFRVDNPHTKPFRFWEWIIDEVKKKHPDVLFLSEAFARPAVMQELGRLGFTMSYTYFTWRNSKEEIIEYMNELTTGATSESFRPNFWPNTPDILPFPLQNANEHQYVTRYFLAATLSSNVGVYGPVYELMVNTGLPGKEEYLDSEKFQVSHWDWDMRTPVTQVYTVVNHARKAQRALQRTNNIRFIDVDNDQLLAYLKTGDDGSKVLCVVSLDGHHAQAGQVRLNPGDIGKEGHEAIELHDLRDDHRYTWHGDSHFVMLEPSAPYHLFVLS
ncbi:alpha-1,4-glucan--maltose-1-phosphate maltosyltransferase [Sanyastnella coralliicola]|uniref:alpha-1,4-glucan--maltose-1-phosphate maltosyltransferase n=1 Tax=Sanyastnella coralliicola TaxID=3069118 RepID=UPI0027B8DCF7|nr:alpha-1,4-glucan--maltose-1-phosphate maltosyltransferase [Longitalea sp. SCSIO 12813]